MYCTVVHNSFKDKELYTYTEDELLGLFRGSRASNIVHETSLPIAVITDTTSGLEKGTKLIINGYYVHVQ